MSGVFAILMAVGCTSSPVSPVEGSSTATVEIVPGEIETRSGVAARLEAVVRDAEGQLLPGGVDWSTSDESVAIVDTDGRVWSFSTGTATATASFPGKGNNGNAYGHAKKNAEVQVVEETPDRPGRVTTLAVSSMAAESATLSFTEVDDGKGGAAEYLVRFQVSPLNWGSAIDVAAGTCAAPLRGSGEGTLVSCTVANLEPGTAYQFQVVAIRPSDDVHGDLSNVASGTTLVPTTSDGSRPNEPPGMVAIASVDFSDSIKAKIGQCTEGTDSWKRSNREYIAGGSTPTGTGSAWRGKFPSGAEDGISYWRFDCWGPSQSIGEGAYQYDEIYVSFWLRIDGSDFQNQSVGTKILYIAYGTSDRYNDSYLMLDGAGSQTVQTSMRLRARLSTQDENGDTPGFSITPNVDGNKKVRVGEWTHVEVRMKVNEIGADNGEFDLWVDGTHTTSVRDWRYRSAISPRAFYHLQFTPVYGGHSGDIRTRDDYWRIDDLYISRR